MNSNNTADLGSNYIDAVKIRETAYDKMAHAVGTSISTFVRYVGQTLVDSSDELEQILTGENARSGTVSVIKEVRKYMDVRQVSEPDLPLVIDTALHCRKVLSPAQLFGETRAKLAGLAANKLDGFMDVAEALLNTVTDYVDEVDISEANVQDTLNSMNEAALSGEAAS